MCADRRQGHVGRAQLVKFSQQMSTTRHRHNLPASGSTARDTLLAASRLPRVRPGWEDQCAQQRRQGPSWLEACGWHSVGSYCWYHSPEDRRWQWDCIISVSLNLFTDILDVGLRFRLCNRRQRIIKWLQNEGDLHLFLERDLVLNGVSLSESPRLPDDSPSEAIHQANEGSISPNDLSPDQCVPRFLGRDQKPQQCHQSPLE